MTPQEFKAWFEGFTEAFGSKLPTKVQWARIKERVGEIDGKPITERIFVDRWYPYWQTHYATYTPTITIPYYSTCNVPAASLTGINYASAASSNFDSCVAMNAVGRAEAASLTG
jgi:hypothetical protein